MKILVKSHGKVYKITNCWDSRFDVEIIGFTKRLDVSATLFLKGINEDLKLHINTAIDVDSTGYPLAISFGDIFSALVKYIRKYSIEYLADVKLSLYANAWTSAGCNYDHCHRALSSSLSKLEDFESNCQMFAKLHPKRNPMFEMNPGSSFLQRMMFMEGKLKSPKPDMSAGDDSMSPAPKTDGRYDPVDHKIDPPVGYDEKEDEDGKNECEMPDNGEDSEETDD